MNNLQFSKFKSLLILASAVILLAAGCNKMQPGSRPAPSSQPAATTEQTPSSTGQASPTGQMQTRQNAGKPDYTPGYVVVSGTVEGSNLNHQYDKVKEGTTAYDLLASTHQVQAKDYGSMGKFVQSIDGIAPDSKHFWSFYVNGKTSAVGASSYALKDGDTIEWKLDVIK